MGNTAQAKAGNMHYCHALLQPDPCAVSQSVYIHIPFCMHSEVILNAWGMHTLKKRTTDLDVWAKTPHHLEWASWCLTAVGDTHTGFFGILWILSAEIHKYLKWYHYWFSVGTEMDVPCHSFCEESSESWQTALSENDRYCFTYSFFGSSNSVCVHACMCAGVCIQDHDTIVHWKFLTSGCCVCVCACCMCVVCVYVCVHMYVSMHVCKIMTLMFLNYDDPLNGRRCWCKSYVSDLRLWSKSSHWY